MGRLGIVGSAALALFAAGLSRELHQEGYEAGTAPTPWRAKLRNTSTTVAASRRIARKRRNIRARNPK